MKFSRERVAHVTEEILPLLRKHFEEVSYFQDCALSPDFSQYEKAEENGVIRLYTVRKLRVLVGYSLFIVSPHHHYAHLIQANQDVIYIEKKYRGFLGSKLIAFCEEELRAEGVNVIFQHMNARHSFGRLLELRGYDLMDLSYAKRLN